MQEIRVTLPDNITAELDEASREAGLSSTEIIQKAVSDYLFVRKFRLLRERLMTRAKEGYSDQDIFGQVS